MKTRRLKWVWMKLSGEIIGFADTTMIRQDNEYTSDTVSGGLAWSRMPRQMAWMNQYDGNDRNPH